MKIYHYVLLAWLLPCSCSHPGGRSWIIPVTIDPSDLQFTPDKLEEFQARRERLLDTLQDEYVILKSSDQQSFNRNKFRPNNYFYYLTGMESSRAYAVLTRQGNASFILGMPPENIRLSLYEGEGMPAAQAEELYRPDRLLSYYGFSAFLDSVVQSGATLYVDRSDPTFYNELRTRLERVDGGEIRDLGRLAGDLRVHKGPVEVDLLQKACNITALSLTGVMKACEPGLFEFEMEAIIEGTYLQYGASMPGFPSIVASGPNSTILHYETNSRRMESGDLLLMDIGAEYGYYTADITRTIPVSGKFSEEQRVIYQLVLDAQKAAIDSMLPGKPFSTGHATCKALITKGLYELGLITDSTATWQSDLYTLHGFSHFLGLDVHDVGRGYPTLEPGMVLTIEPGIYFREKGLEQLHELYGDEADSTAIEAFIERVGPLYDQYLHIGVRIEDDILITDRGNINLSRYAPKEIGDIEQLMR